ncbi:MAG TPA: thioredoxin family protein [Burkholderiaceae bacterium]
MTASAPLTIACLCAAWCGTCRDYQAVFDSLQATLPGHHWRWIDIEDEADLAGDVDITTFPTLLIAAGPQVLFAGVVLPKEADTARLITAVAEGHVAGAAAPASRMPASELAAFAAVAAALHAA